MPGDDGEVRRISRRWDNAAMFRWITRFVLFRFLPRRLLPILTVVELIRLVRGFRRPRYAVNEPVESRTAPPPRISPPPSGSGMAPPAGDLSEPGA
jgi:hypothetical protein